MPDIIDQLTGAQEPQDPQKPKPSPFTPAEYADRVVRERNDAFRSHWAQAIKTDPDAHAESLRIAASLGVQPADIPDIKVARELQSRRDVERMRLWNTHPVLMRALEIPNVARFAHDDLDNLKRVESTWLELKFAVASGRNQAEQDLLWERVSRKGGIWDEPDTLERQRLEAEASDLPQSSGLLVTPLRYLIGQNQPLVKQAAAEGVIGLGVGFAIGAYLAAGPQAPIGVVTAPGGALIGGSVGFYHGLISAGQRMQAGASYREAVKRGVVHGQALAVSQVVGTATALLDFVGLKGIASPITSRIFGQAIKQAMVRPTTTGAGLRFSKEVLRSTGGEVATENVQELVAMGGEAITGKKITLDEYLDRAGAVTKEAFLASLIPGTLGPVLGAVHDIHMAAEASRNAKFFSDVADGVAAAKMTKRSPTAMRNFLGQLQQGTEVTDAYINAGVLREVLQQSEMSVEDLRKLSPTMADQLQQAELDEDVVVPLKDYAVDVAGTGLGKKLMQHVRPSEDARSLDQAQKILLKQTELFQEADDIAKEAAEESETFGKQVAKIEGEFRDQLLAAAKASGSKIDEEQVAFLSKLHRALVITQSKRAGMSPEEWVAKNRVGVGTDGGVASDAVDANTDKSGNAKGRTDTPEFRQWFGKSAVANGDGNPIIVYHGSRASFEAFSKAKLGSNTGARSARKGFFFAGNPETAQSSGYIGERVIPEESAVVRARQAVKAAAASWPALLVMAQKSASGRSALRRMSRVGLLGDDMSLVPSMFDESESGLSSEFAEAEDIVAEFNFVVRAVGDEAASMQIDDPGVGLDVTRVPGEGASVYPVYLSIQNPMVHDFGGAGYRYRDRTFSGIIREAIEKGHDGVILRNTTDGGPVDDIYVVFDPTQVKSVFNKGDWSKTDQRMLYSGDPSKARGSYDRAAKRILLNKKSDVSTIVHELSHFYLDTLIDSAEAMTAPGFVDDARDVFKWFGVKDVKAWRALTAEQQEKHHETFAYNFELWMFEGKAPSKQLEGVFKRVLQWMRQVYESIRTELNEVYRKRFGTDLPMLTDDIRGVFDRMLASEKEIMLMREIRSMEPMFQTKEQALKEGMTEEQWAEYDHWRQQDEFESVEEWMLANVRTAKWWRTSKDRLLKKLQKQADAERKRVTEEVTQDLLRQPVYRVRHWLKTGKVLKADGTEIKGDGGKALRKSDVDSFFERAGGIDKKTIKDAGITVAEDGIPVEVVRERFGYATGDDMLLDLATAPKQKSEDFNAAVAAAVEGRMLMEHTEIATADGRANQVDLMLHNEARMKFLATEWKFLSGSTEPTKVLADAARHVAEVQIDGTTVKRINGRDFGNAEARAARDAKKAMRDGDREASITAKRRHLLASQMTAAALKARQEIRDALEFFKEVRGGPDAKLAKKRDLDFVLAARAILSAYELGGSKTVDQHMELIRRFDPAFYDEIKPVVDRATQAEGDFTSLTLDEFRAMRDAVKALWTKSLRAKEIQLAGKRQSIADWKARALPLVAQAAAIPHRVRSKTLVGFKALLGRVEHWARKLDGGKAGPWTELFREIKDRVTDLNRDRRGYLKRMRDLVAGHDFSGGAISDGVFQFASKRELLGALQHAGNESNLKKNIVGRGWVKPDESGKIDFSTWWAFIDRMSERGILTKADFDFVQAIWDLNESLLPEMQRTHHAIKGYYFKVVPVTPIVTRFGVYRGGYVPAKIDYDAAGKPPPQAAQGLDALTEMERDANDVLPSTGSGFTIERVGNRDPLLHDVGINLRHIDEALRYIHLQEAVQDIAKLLRDDEVGTALQGYQQGVVSDMLIPWLQRVALQQTKKHGMSPFWDRVFNAIRRSSGASIMFLNVVNAAQQMTGIANVGVYVKATYLRNASLRVMGSPIEVVREIAGKSAYMDERLNHEIGEIMDEIQLALDPSKWGSFNRAINRNAYFLQHVVQNRADAIAWVGAYDQAMAEKTAGMTEEEAEAHAIAEADSVVRMSQGSTAPEDIARFEAQTPFIRLFTMFTGYFNTILNQIMGERTVTGKAKATVMAMLVPAIVGAAIQQAFWGGWDDEEEDGYGDDVAKWGFGIVTRAGLASFVPVIGPAVWSMMDPTTVGDRMALSPALTQIQAGGRFFRDLGNLIAGNVDVAGEGEHRKGWRAGDFRDFTTAVSMISRIPLNWVGRGVSYWWDEREGNVEEATGAVDYARGLLSGR